MIGIMASAAAAAAASRQCDHDAFKKSLQSMPESEREAAVQRRDERYKVIADQLKQKPKQDDSSMMVAGAFILGMIIG